MAGYRWVEGARFGGDASAVGDALEAVREKSGGVLTAESVVQEAAKKRSPLRRYFEWNDGAAAREYRLYQARNLIRAVEVVVEERADLEVNAFLHFASAGGYVRASDAVQDDALRGELERRGKAELAGLRRKYGHLKIFAGIMAEIDRLVAAG